ncbi:hypothetical protein [Persephonella sp.]
MSIVERILFWTAIVVLVAGIIGMKAEISELEAKLQQAVEASSEGGEE